MALFRDGSEMATSGLRGFWRSGRAMNSTSMREYVGCIGQMRSLPELSLAARPSADVNRTTASMSSLRQTTVSP